MSLVVEDKWAVRVVDEIQKLLKMKPTARLLFPTGSTPLPVYAEMSRRVFAGEMSLAEATIFNLDEYWEPSMVESYRYYMMKFLLGRVPFKRWYFPDRQCYPTAETPEEVAASYAKDLTEAPIDFALVGIGLNGHVAFNEPGLSDEQYAKAVHVVELSAITRHANNVQYTRAITVGLSPLQQARRVVMIATGESKADIVARLISSMKSYTFTSDVIKCPAVGLCKCPDFTLVCDVPAVKGHVRNLVTSKPARNRHNQRVLVFSPHPDDDVIGMGAKMAEYAETGYIVDVCYMTGGRNKTRVLEAIAALQEVCPDSHTAHFLDLPFYSRVDRKVTGADVEAVKDFFEQTRHYFDQHDNYQAIYVCGDLRDPSGTHLRCYKILKEVLQSLSWTVPVQVYFSVWETPDLVRDLHLISGIFRYADDIARRKRYSILCHKSQLRENMRAVDMGHITKEFWEYIEERNLSQNCICDRYKSPLKTYVEIFADMEKWSEAH